LAEPFRLTFGRWYNKYDPETERTAKAPLLKAGFSYDSFAYGSDTPEQFAPDDGAAVQVSLICARQTQLLVIDVDHPEQFAVSATGQAVSWANAMSTRGSHFHVGVDMRGAADEDWPVQGRTSWGDVKSNGFVAAPGSVHYTGEPYQPTSASVPDKLVPWTPELLTALAADKDALVQAKRAEWGMTGAKLDDGSHLYASGYAGGSWTSIPDGGLRHDDELKDLLFDMHVRYGREEAECRSEWERLAGALEGPWRDRDFTRHWRKLPALRLDELEKDEATRLLEDFGLSPGAPAWQQEQQRQQARHEASAPAGRPAPPPGWGFEVPGVDYFTLWLGSTVFDAGKPNDADNALAVLTRAHQVLRYDEEAGTWLLRGAGKWTPFTGSAGPRAVINGLRSLMPEGCADPVKAMDKDPETDGTEIAALKAQAKNRERFSASAQIGAVAAVMADTVLRHRGAGSVVRAGRLDTEREVLWAGGVPWDLRASAHGPVPAALDRGTPHLMTAPVVPDPSCPTPLWDAYCRAVFPDLPQGPDSWGDKPEAGREWALDVLAAAFTGYADAVMPVLLGETRLGKTFLVNLLTSVLGDYGGIMSGDLLKADARLHGSFTLKLKGMRLAFVDEAPGKGKASQEHLKKITGGGKLEGNKMRENPVEFFPTHTLVLATNVPPELTDPALRARARMIRFEGDRAAVKAAAADLGASAESPQWKAEMPGVLAAMMSRAAAWLADRSVADTERAPRLWQAWTDEIVADQDSLDGWLHCGEIVAEAHPGTTADKLHQHYVTWCKSHGVPVELPPITFGIKLKAAGYTSRKSTGVKWWPLRILPYGAADFMGGPGHQGGLASPLPPTVPPTVPSQNPSSGTVGSVFRDSRDSTHTTNTHNTRTHTRTHTQDETTKNRPYPSNRPSAATDLGKYPLDGEGGTVPAVVFPAEPEGGTSLAAGERALAPETGKKPRTGKEPKTPPKAKTPRNRLTDEEKLERAEARKAKLAADRLEARAARVAELGGPLVPLPAIVLRDQTVIPVDAATAARFLAGTLDEVSADVEHSGYPRPHKDYRLRLVQLGNEFAAVVFDPSDEAQAAVIRDVLASAKILHAHSALADLIPLEAAGLCDASVWDRILDTVNLAKLTDPALCDSDEAALKPLAKNLLGPGYALSWRCDELRKELFAAGGWISDLEADTEPGRSGWLNVPLCEAFVRYAASDVMDCSAVARVLSQEA
jgi:hypothetical protein